MLDVCFSSTLLRLKTQLQKDCSLDLNDEASSAQWAVRSALFIAWSCEHGQRAVSSGGLVVEVAVLLKLGMSLSRV